MINRLFNGIKTLAMSSAMKPDLVFVLGAPGAGKGTQCENIVKVSSDMTIFMFVILPCLKNLMQLACQCICAIQNNCSLACYTASYLRN